MSTLKKAYAFVKKYWGSDDDVLPSDLNRYEDGIDDLYSVTNKTNTNIGNLSNLLSQAKSNIVTAINEIVTNLQSEIETRGNTDTELERQINVLSNEKMDKNKDNITEKGLTIDNWLTIDGDTGGKSNFLCNLYNDNDGNYRYVNSHGGGSGAGFRTSIFDRKPKFIYSTDIAATKDEIANIVEIDLATTDKTDILVTPNTGYTITFNNSCKINNIAYINVRVKKTDGSEFISGAQVTPFTLPLTAGGETNGNGNGASGGFWRVPATVLFTGNTVVVNPTSNCTQIHITGAIVL